MKKKIEIAKKAKEMKIELKNMNTKKILRKADLKTKKNVEAKKSTVKDTKKDEKKKVEDKTKSAPKGVPSEEGKVKDNPKEASK
jgi:hypothetical protein